MIQINSLASSSKGNCHYTSDGVTPLLLDCGIPFADIRRLLNFQTSGIEGILISHSHKDHCRSAKDFIKAGIDCYMAQQTAEEVGISGHRVKIIEPKKQFSIGTWNIIAFDLVHDVSNMGFLLQNQVGEKLCYITDSSYCHYKFEGLNYILLECNYSLGILNENVAKGIIPFEMKKRLIKTHFSLDNVKEFLKANDLSGVHEIHLIHLSGQNSSADTFKKEVQRLTGKIVIIANE